MRRIFTLTILLTILGAQARLASQTVYCFSSASVLAGCPPLVVDFTDSSIGSPTTHFWDFDNGGMGNSNIQNPTYTFINPGVYNVKHIVSNATSSDTCYITIHVFVPPTVNFTSPNHNGCIFPCHNVDLINLSSPGESPIQEYVWNFGDGTLPVSVLPPQSNTDHCYNQVGSYNVTLIVRDSNTCQSNLTLANYVVIGNFPTANAQATPIQSCNSPTVVNFTGSGTSTNGAITYTWFFGNGGNSVQQNPSQVFFNGIYDPILIVTDTLGCQDTAFTHVEITQVNAGFSVPFTNVCNGIGIQFTDTSNFASTWLWNFGDGTTSNQQNPLHTYTANGTYTVTLTVSYNGCVDVETRTNYITVTTPVQFLFSANDTSDCAAPFAVNFTSNVSGGGTPTYQWDFGDNSTSTQANPSHTYTSEGSFTVSLTVSSPGGCQNTKTYTNYINVHVINASFSIDSDMGCTPLTVHFTNNSTSNVPITGYQWIFGDGSVSAQANPVHVYNTAGQYTPILVITNADGCLDTTVYSGVINVGGGLLPDFNAQPLIQCVNQSISFFNLTQGAGVNTHYLWDFGDGQTSILANPVHEYSDTGYYDITLTVINQGCSAEMEKLHYVLIIVPKADFGFEFNCSSPTTVAFSDSSQGADTWFWDFGDGATSNQQNPTHTFPSQAGYTVTLTVTNNTTGCVDSIKKTLPIGTPAANLSSDTTQGCVPLKIRFKDISVFASSWLWIFGDGTTSALQNPIHTYSDTGQYTVTLVINPGAACTDTVTQVNYITAFGVKPQLVAIPTSGCSPLTVAFKDSSTSYMGTVNAWTWAFGNGDSSHVKNPTYTYTSAVNATFTVKLTVSDTHGCKATKSFNGVKVYHPVAAFSSDTFVCPGEPVKFTNHSTGAQSYRWYFGDGTSSTQANPTHIYTNSGTYAVTLVAINTASGCSDSIVIANYILVEIPMADFFVTSNFSPCPPFPVQFYNISNRPDIQWTWYFGDGDTSSYKDPLHVYFYPGDYDVSLIVYDSSGCRDTMTKVAYISVRGPKGQFIASQDSGCVPVSITISGTTQSTVSMVADMGDGVAFQDSTNITYTYTQAGTYYPVYTLTDSLGCVVSYPVDTFVVGDIPYPNLPDDTTVCKGNYIQFNLPAGDHFIWTADQSPTYLSCDTCINPLSTAPDTISYYVTAITNIGCEATDTIVVNVDALPIIFPGVSFRICPGDTLQLNAGSNVQTATWTPELFMDDSTIVSPKVWPPDSMIYRVTGANQTGCSISRIVKIWVIDKVKAEVNVSDTLLCEGGDVQLQVNVLEASVLDTMINWTPLAHLSGYTIPNPLFRAPHGDYTYSVIVSSKNCVSDTEQVHIVVAPKPSVVAGDDQTVAVQTQVRLWAASPNPVSYFWTPTIDSFDCTDCRRPYVTVTADQVVYAYAMNEWGCEASDSVVLKVVNCDPNAIFVPNVFTPNNDGLNDRLFVRGIGLKSLDYFRIFDRWGRLEFETKNINEGWDGMVNGHEADAAAYVYVLKAVCSSGQEVIKSGNVTLIR